VERLNRGIALATQAADNGTRSLLERILVEEEDAIDFLEAHNQMVQDMGRENYLAQIMTVDHGS
jgi:bacterioferritin